MDTLRVKGVRLPAPLPLVDATDLQFRVRHKFFGIGQLVTDQHLAGQPVVADPLDPADATPEALIDYPVVEAQYLEDLRTLVRL